jgi:NodT family efflux transporter outer membrane factor (OMF) lipoprotein
MDAQPKRVKSVFTRIIPNVRSWTCLLAVLVAASYLTGCAHLGDWMHNGFKVGPNYKRPAAPIADAWIDYNGRHIISEPVDDSHWWTVFNDPQLDSLIESAYAQNISLREAGMRVLEARAQRGIAAGAILPQQQDVTMDFRRVNVALGGNNLGVIPDSFNFDLWQLGGKIGWELDIWGKYRRAIEAADADLDASIEDYDDMLVCLLAETATAYVDIRTFQNRIQVARENVELQEETVRIVKAKVDLGARGVTRADLTTAQSLMNETQAAIPVLEAQLRSASNRLCVLLGVPPRDLLQELGDPNNIPTAPSQVAVGIPAELLRRRPDIRAAERMVAAQSARIGVAASELFPHFTLAGSVSYSGSKFRDMFNAQNLNGAVGPSAQWNILHYGRLVNNIRVQDAKFQQTALKYQDTVIRANAEVEDALIAFAKAREEAEFLEQSVQETMSTYETIKTRVDEGAEEVFRLNEVQKDLVRRQNNLAVAQSNISLQLIRIYKTLGGGWQIREQHHGDVLVGLDVIEPEPLPDQQPNEAEPLPEPPQPELDQPAMLPDIVVPSN